MRPHEGRVAGQGSLRDRRHPERLRRQHESGDIAAAIHGTVDVERLVRGDDGDMRRSEEAEVLQRLPFGALVITFQDAELAIQRKSALAPPQGVYAAVFPRPRQVRFVVGAALRVGVHRLAKALGTRAAGYRDLPRLAGARSEERRVGKEWVRTCRSGWSTDHYKKKTKKIAR